MQLPEITVQLSAFEQIEILRKEIEKFEEELKKTEVRIRELLYEHEKQRYLQTIHPIFHHGAEIPGAEQLPEMYSAREALSGGLEAMKQAQAQLEMLTGTAPAPQKAAAPVLPPRPGPTRSPGIAPQPSSPNVSNPGLRRNRFDF